MSEDAIYRKLYESAPDMFLSVDTHTATVARCNQTLLTRLGLTRDEVIGQPLASLYHPDDLPRVKENVACFRETGEIKHREFRVRKKDGGYVDVHLSFAPLLEDDGTARYSNAIWRDISAIVALRELKVAGATTPVLFGSATVLFTDFVGFSKTAGNMEPADLVGQLDEYFTAFDEIIEANGLEKLKTIGDAYMCVGGIPKRNETHADDCCRAALAMVRRAALIGKQRAAEGHPAWGLRVGINTGPIIAGVVGTKKFAYDVWGDAVNLAARLESAGAPGRVNISASTKERIDDYFHTEFRGKLAVKNMGEVEMYFVE